MMNFALKYILIILNYIEHARHSAYEALAPWMEQRELITNNLGELEKKFRNYNPFTLLIGFFLFFFIVRWLLRKLRNIWRSISKFII
jgi:hypothetical protein